MFALRPLNLPPDTVTMKSIEQFVQGWMQIKSMEAKPA
jgi:hypothetical protein